jgi:hypothetical protein
LHILFQPLNRSEIDRKTRVINADAKWDARNRRVDLAYLASIWAPNCDAEALRMMVDWNHWVSFEGIPSILKERTLITTI